MRLTNTFFIAVVICLWSTIAFSKQYQHTYYFDNPVVADSANGYSNVSINGQDNYSVIPGAPVLPYKQSNILIGSNERITSVKVEGNQLTLIAEGVKVDFGRSPSPISLATAHDNDLPNPDIYESDATYPENIKINHRIRRLHGNKIANTVIAPVVYLPQSQILQYYPSITVTVETEIEVKPAMVGDSNAIKPSGKYSDMRLIEQIVDNPEDINKLMPEIKPATAALTDREYLIITAGGFVNAFQRLADFRETELGGGFTTHIETVANITTNWPGIDDAESIRNYIRDNYENHGTRYVVLGGDADGIGVNFVPVRGAFGSVNTTVDDNIPTDLYYGCLDGTWDNNGNGIYGELDDGIGGGSVDLDSEVYVGRIPADSVAEANNLITKIIAFENDIYQSHEVLLVSRQLDDDSLGGDRLDFVYEGMGGLEVERLYRVWGTDDLLDIINDDKVFWISNVQHGNNHNSMNFFGSSSWDNIDGMNNDDYFFIYSESCYIGAFDNRRTDGSFETDDTVAESFVVAYPDRAAVGIIANSRFGWYCGGSSAAAINCASAKVHRSFADTISAANGDIRLGQANQLAKSNIPDGDLEASVRWTIFAANLLGDPALNLKNQFNNSNNFGYIEDVPTNTLLDWSKETVLKASDMTRLCDTSFQPGGIVDINPASAEGTVKPTVLVEIPGTLTFNCNIRPGDHDSVKLGFADSGTLMYEINGAWSKKIGLTEQEGKGWRYRDINISGSVQCGISDTLDKCLTDIDNNRTSLKLKMRYKSSNKYDTVKSMKLRFYRSGVVVGTKQYVSKTELSPYVVVTTSSSEGGAISPSLKEVTRGESTTFTVTPDSGYKLYLISGCEGSLSGNTYTTGVLNEDCQIRAEFGKKSYMVEALSGTGGSISPTVRNVIHGETTSFTVTTDTGYSISSVTGCGGSLSGNTYTTGAITGACTVSATFSNNTYLVSTNAGAGGAISPTSKSVAYGEKTSFTVTPDTGYDISSVTGCGGSLSGNTYTTGVITSACTVSASFSSKTYTVIASAGQGGSISPASKTVNHGDSTSFAITSNSGYSIDTATGCNGTLNGNTYTTGEIIANCAVSITFKAQPVSCNDETADLETHLENGRVWSEYTGGSCWGTFCWGGQWNIYTVGSDILISHNGKEVHTLHEMGNQKGIWYPGACPSGPMPPVIDSVDKPVVTIVDQVGDDITFRTVVTGTASDVNNDLKEVHISTGVGSIPCEGTTKFTCTYDLTFNRSSLPVEGNFFIAAIDKLDSKSEVVATDLVKFEERPVCVEYTETLNEHLEDDRIWSEYVESCWGSFCWGGKWNIYTKGTDELISHDGRETHTLHEFSNEPGVWHHGACPY